jgi:hypothetical protein
VLIAGSASFNPKNLEDSGALMLQWPETEVSHVHSRSEQMSRRQVAGIADFDPKATTRAGVVREQMKRVSQDRQRPGAHAAAEREGIAPRSGTSCARLSASTGPDRDEGLKR